MVLRRLSCTSLVVVLLANASGARAEEGKAPSPFAHPSVAGSDITVITLHDGREILVLPFAELAEKRLESGPKSVTFTAEGEALFVPHCGGRKRVLVAGRDVAAPADGPLVVPLPKGRVDVAIEVVASKYERRVACAEAPRVGVPVTADAGFSTLKFTSPSAAKGGGVAVVYVPKNHDPKKPATVLMGVHPWNGGVWTYAQYTDLVREADKLDVVLLHPSGLGNSLYVAEAETEVLRALAELEKAMPVDPLRISIWGASMGGQGATTIGFHKPSRFASVTSFFGDAKFDVGTYVRNILHDEAGAHAVNPIDVIDNARNLPVRLIHGESDTTSPIRQSELLEQALRARKFSVRFDRVPATGHEGRLVERFAGEVVRRAASAVAPEFPTHVTFRSVRPEDTEAYGVRIERTGAGDAYVDLESKDNRVFVSEAQGVRAIVLKKGALGLPDVRPVEGTRVPVRWE
jgi:predicted esterase